MKKYYRETAVTKRCGITGTNQVKGETRTFQVAATARAKAQRQDTTEHSVAWKVLTATYQTGYIKRSIPVSRLQLK